ncbi:mandelate racemase/muconate lactonizing enzyme family protein [Halomicrococcus sp. NG-SE-24]|uniref:mandelate racemase/muconate lactonizing enzyme family protein n=1 Tax=Halomicrococcus sp. NG-SE-24 TaxID=3436928 RepID=UPI003D97EEED
MKITDIEAIPITADVKPLGDPDGIAPYVTSGGRVESAERMLIRLETDTDVTGWGEMMIEIDPLAMKTLIEREVAPRLIGRDVWETESVVQNHRYFYVDIASLYGGVEMAMWDAFGKHLQTPIHQLLGGKCSDTVETAYCVGILDVEASRDHAQHAIDEGYSVLKTKGGRDWEQDVERIVAMDEAVDGELQFRIDPNQAWSFDEAVRVGARLEDEGVYVQYLEQPNRIETYGAYQRLRERLRQPIGANDDTYFAHNLYHLVKNDAIDVGIVDVVPSGVTGLRQLAGVAADAGISLAHHCGFDLGVKTAAMLHTVASTDAFNLPSDSVYYAWEDHIIGDPFTIDAGALTVPDDPGLGVTVDRSKVEELRLDV